MTFSLITNLSHTILARNSFSSKLALNSTFKSTFHRFNVINTGSTSLFHHVRLYPSCPFVSSHCSSCSPVLFSSFISSSFHKLLCIQLLLQNTFSPPFCIVYALSLYLPLSFLCSFISLLSLYHFLQSQTDILAVCSLLACLVNYSL